MIDILVVLPYLEIKETFEKVIQAYSQPGITISITPTIGIGTDPFLIEKLDADIIVARGITAGAIARLKPASHVITIPIGTGDLLAALSLAKKKCDPCHIGVITNIKLCESEEVASLVGCPVTIRRVADQKEVRDAVFSLRDQGCTVFVGGLTMTNVCKENHMEHVHVNTGLDAIVSSIEDAIAAAKSLERAKTRGNLLEVLLNNANYALFAINSYGVVITGNSQAKILFSGKPLEGKNIDDFYPGSNWTQTLASGEVIEELQTIGSQQVLAIQQPLKVDSKTSGVLYTFQNTKDIEKTEHKVRTQLSQKGLVAKYTFNDIITRTSGMFQVLEKAKRLSSVDGAVLLLGETGTGKELFVQSMHNNSRRKQEPFVAVNCAALPEHLLESELFGYTEGAFTGASKGGKTGLFELAHKGTLFLDEIGEMPIVLQAKLLRVLQENEVRKIGADSVIPIDVRIISAANCNILERVNNGSFRLDLFYRISLLSLQIPSLRERKDDIGLLFRHFVEVYCKRYHEKIPTISDSAIKVLQEFDWPGNIRELRNAAERSAILNSNEEIRVLDIEQLDIGLTNLYRDANSPTPPKKPRVISFLSDDELYQEFLSSGLSREVFAQRVGMSRTTLWRILSKLEH